MGKDSSADVGIAKTTKNHIYFKRSAGNLPENGNGLQIYNKIFKQYLTIIKKEYSNPDLNFQTIAEKIGCSMKNLNEACLYESGVKAKYCLYKYRFIKGIKIIFDGGELTGKKIGYIDSRVFYKALKSRIGICKSDLMTIINNQNREDKKQLCNEIINLISTKNRMKKKMLMKEIKAKIIEAKLRLDISKEN